MTAKEARKISDAAVKPLTDAAKHKATQCVEPIMKSIENACSLGMTEVFVPIEPEESHFFIDALNVEFINHGYHVQYMEGRAPSKNSIRISW